MLAFQPIMKSDTTALHYWLRSPAPLQGRSIRWRKFAGSILKHIFSFFPLCRGLRLPLNEKKETASGSTERGWRSFCFAHRAIRPEGQCFLISMAKEYVGYSGEEPSSPGHSVAAVTCEGKGECTGGLRNLRRALYER